MSHTLLHPSNRNSLLIILWGLLFMKCFILEYLVHYYTVPINSVIYVWSLSIFMATAATIVYLGLQAKEFPSALAFPPSTSIWCACLIGVLLIVAAGFIIESLPLLQIPALIGLVLGLGYCAQGLLDKHLPSIFSGFGWWLGAVILFWLNSLNILLLFALFILLFSVLPPLIGMLRRRHEISDAMQTLKA